MKRNVPTGQRSAAPMDDRPRDPTSDARVARRAFELWEARGRPAGDPLRDWLEAERQIARERDGAFATKEERR